MVENGGKEVGVVVDLMVVLNFNIGKVLWDKLKVKGIELFFLI